MFIKKNLRTMASLSINFAENDKPDRFRKKAQPHVRYSQLTFNIVFSVIELSMDIVPFESAKNPSGYG
jgi:hypothetical protein